MNNHPSTSDAERGLLACCVVGGRDSTAKAIESGMVCDWFTSREFKLYAKALLSLHERSEEINELTVQETLEQSGDFERAGGMATLLSISGSVDTPAALLKFLEQTAAGYRERRIDELAGRIPLLFKEGREEQLSVAREEFFKLLDQTSCEGHKAAIELHTHEQRIERAQEPRNWLVERFIEAGTINAIIALPGEGKTLVSAELAVCIAAGLKFADRATKQGKVLYACQDSPDDTERRLAGVCDAAGKNILTAPDIPSLPGGIPALERIITANEITFCVLDTWDSIRDHSQGGYAAQDEALEMVMRGLRRLGRKTGCAFVIVHHATRQDSGRARGSVVFDARADTISLVRKEDGLRLELIKNRLGPVGPVGQFDIRATSDGVPYIEFTGVPRNESPSMLKMRRVLAAIEEGHTTHRDIAQAAEVSPGSIGHYLRSLKAKNILTDDGKITAKGLSILG